MDGLPIKNGDFPYSYVSQNKRVSHQKSMTFFVGCLGHPRAQSILHKLVIYIHIHMAVCQNLVPLVNIKIAGK